MPVTNSSYQVDAHAQADGSRYVTETHDVSVGPAITCTYLALAGTDYQAVMLSHVPQINARLVEGEVSRLVDSEDDVFSLTEQTPSAFAQKFWIRLQSAKRANNREKYHRMVWKLWKWVQTGALTSEQVRQSFNSFFGTNYASGAEWNTFVQDRMVPIKDRYLAWRDEKGLE